MSSKAADDVNVCKTVFLMVVQAAELAQQAAKNVSTKVWPRLPTINQTGADAAEEKS